MYYLQTFSRKTWKKERRFLELQLILTEYHPNNSGAQEFRQDILFVKDLHLIARDVLVI